MALGRATAACTGVSLYLLAALLVSTVHAQNGCTAGTQWDPSRNRCANINECRLPSPVCTPGARCVDRNPGFNCQCRTWWGSWRNCPPLRTTTTTTARSTTTTTTPFPPITATTVTPTTTTRPPTTTTQPPTTTTLPPTTTTTKPTTTTTTTTTKPTTTTTTRTTTTTTRTTTTSANATTTATPIPSQTGLCNGLADSSGRRVRKEWRELTPEQQQNYINAIRALVRTNTFTQVMQYHTTDDTNRYAHGSNAFIHWHRHMLILFENQLRALGGTFSCITIPYWDWTQDVKPNTNANPDISVIRDWNGISSRCLMDDFIGRYRYDGNRCVTRPFGVGWRPLGPAGFAEFTVRTRAFADYIDWNKAWHGQIHVNTGGRSGTMNDIAYSPWDPIFFLHHAFVDKMGATWQACHGYDRATNGPISRDVYTTNSEGIAHGYDDAMPTFPTSLTPRSVNSIAALGYTYAPDALDRTTYAQTMGACPFDIPWVPRASTRSSVAMQEPIAANDTPVSADHAVAVDMEAGEVSALIATPAGKENVTVPIDLIHKFRSPKRPITEETIMRAHVADSAIAHFSDALESSAGDEIKALRKAAEDECKELGPVPTLPKKWVDFLGIKAIRTQCSA